MRGKAESLKKVGYFYDSFTFFIKKESQTPNVKTIKKNRRDIIPRSPKTKEPK